MKIDRRSTRAEDRPAVDQPFTDVRAERDSLAARFIQNGSEIPFIFTK